MGLTEFDDSVIVFLFLQISYSSTAVILSDKNRFPTFMRTVPNDLYQTQAMARLLSDSGWNWVGVVITDGDYGRSALDNFVSQASDKAICVAFKQILPGSVISTEFQSAIRRAAGTILKNPKVKVIVSFTKPTHMLHLYEELRRQVSQREGLRSESMKRIWVASDGWSSAGFIRGQMKLGDIGNIVGFTFKSGNMSSFNRFLSGLEAGGQNLAGNISFLEFYTQLNASGNPDFKSNALQNLRVTNHADTIFSVEMAVSAIAHAVANLCHSRDGRRADTFQPWEVCVRKVSQPIYSA